MFKINHIHLRAPDPKKPAQWYVDMFGAKIVGEGPGIGGSQTVRLDIQGSRINVTSGPAGQTLPDGTADLHYGLEHFGFDTDDIEGATARLESSGVEALLPITRGTSGNMICYVKGPDNVRIELVKADT